MKRSFPLICFLLICFLLLFALPVAAAGSEDALFRFPCDPALSPLMASSEHEITCFIDLKEQYYAAYTPQHGDEQVVESGSLLILDNQFLMISLRFSKTFDYEGEGIHLPEAIRLVNRDPDISVYWEPPEWCVMLLPDRDDLYSFHFLGTWNPHIDRIVFVDLNETCEAPREGFSLDVTVNPSDTPLSSLSFPCDSELSPFLAASEHSVSWAYDLPDWHRIATDYWGDDMLFESGTLMVLDDQFMLVDLRFSKTFGYDASCRLPERIILVNQDLSVTDDPKKPLWQVTLYPDEDDPYAFHYLGTWNETMHGLEFLGQSQASEGVWNDGFHLDF